MRRASLDLFHAATVAADALAEAWGGTGVAFGLAWGDPTEIEVLYCRGLREEVCHALGAGTGLDLIRVLRERGEPAIVHRDRLPEEAVEIRDVLDQGGLAGLLLVPAGGPRGATGIMCLELLPEQLELQDGEAALAMAVVDQVAESLRGLALTAAGSALALALAETSEAHPPPDGVVVLDRWNRVLLAFGAPREITGWHGGTFGLSVEDLPGGKLLCDLPVSAAGSLEWQEHLFPPLEGEGIPVSLAATSFAARGEDDAGRIVLLRDLRESRVGRDMSPLLPLALCAATEVEVLEHLQESAEPRDELPMIRRLHNFRMTILHRSAGVPELVDEALHRVMGAQDGWRTDLHALVSEVLSEQEREMLRESVRTLRFLRPELSAVPGSPADLQRIIAGLITHARESMRPDGGTLTVRTWEEKDQVYLSVSDDGQGPHPTESGKGFVPLHTELSPIGRQGRFLEWAREVVEPCDGRLMMENRPGLWNRFTLMLPACAPAEVEADVAPVETEAGASAESAAAAASSTAAQPSPVQADLPPAVEVTRSEEGLQVLVVDDNSSLRSVMRRYLERRGHHVVEAEDGSEALVLVRGQQFDRVVVDMRMPNTDGPTFYAELDAVAPALRDRTIFMTGGFREASVEAFLEQCGRPAIQKPFELSEMARTVEA